MNDSITNEIREIVKQILDDSVIDEEMLLTSAEAAKLMKVNRRWLNIQATAGALPYYLVGRKMLYKRVDVLNFAEQFKKDNGKIYRRAM